MTEHDIPIWKTSYMLRMQRYFFYVFSRFLARIFSSDGANNQ